MEADFSGYATKAGLKCSDGRTITKDAFAHQDKMKVPLVWQHIHNEPTNVLGYAILEHRDESHPDGAGIYAYGYFNETESGQNSKALVQHGDVVALSIYANKLVEKAKQVLHGAIREVSLVLSGANPGALIDNVTLAHSDGAGGTEIETLEDEVIIYSGLALEHTEKQSEEAVEHADGAEETDEERGERVYASFSDEQKDLVHFMIGEALVAADENRSDDTAVHSDLDSTDTSEDNSDDTSEGEAADGASEDSSDDSSDDTSDAGQAEENTNTNDEGDLTHQEGNTDMTTSHSVFDQNGGKPDGPTLSHTDLQTIVENAQKLGSFKDAFLAHAQEYGIEDIDTLFPDAKAVTTQPELIARRTEWVAGIIDGAKHSPFARIKSLSADLTAEEARARGYVKGNLKKDEVIKLLKRVTTPKTIYKKQKLDREDIIDITDLDVVAWLKWEMRFMLEEELARAILIGDGREPDDEDKIDEDHLRPIAWDHEMYAHPVTVPSNTSSEGLVESVIRARKNYKGTGRPTFYTSDDVITDMLLIKDKMGRFTYDDEAQLAAKLRVKELVPVEVFETVPDLLGVIVNMADYTIGADKGGSLSMFDDFDIDYNQYKYLIETRVSGALTKPKSAVVIKRTSGTTVTPLVPEFDEETNTITVPTVAGVAYFDVTNPLSEVPLDDGDDVVITETTDVEARPETGYNFPHNTDADWTFAYTS